MLRQNKPTYYLQKTSIIITIYITQQTCFIRGFLIMKHSFLIILCTIIGSCTIISPSDNAKLFKQLIKHKALPDQVELALLYLQDHLSAQNKPLNPDDVVNLSLEGELLRHADVLSDVIQAVNRITLDPDRQVALVQQQINDFRNHSWR